MTEKLKLCPFCGGEPIICKPLGEITGWVIRCKEWGCCEKGLPPDKNKQDDLLNLIKAWNRQCSRGNTLRDISNESKLNRAEKVALRQIAKEYDKLEAERTKLKTDNKWLWEVFLKMEELAQSGSDMEGHELSYKMCEILHPELYEEVPIVKKKKKRKRKQAKAKKQ